MPAERGTLERRALTLHPFGVTACLAAAAVGGWAVVIAFRNGAMGMDGAMGKGMSMGGGGVDAIAFLAVWVAMVAAMMLPTIQPMVLTYRSLLRGEPRGARRLLMAAFLAPYGVLWAIAGGVALGLWNVGRDHPVAAGSMIAFAGLYQLGTMKGRCLRWCRSPFGFLVHFGGDARSPSGAVVLGARHGALCFGCCAGLMVGFMGAGVISISWLVALGLLMLLEKTHRAGVALARGSGVALLVLGALTALVPLGRLTSEATGLAAMAAVGIAALAIRWSAVLATRRPAVDVAGTKAFRRATRIEPKQSFEL